MVKQTKTKKLKRYITLLATLLIIMSFTSCLSIPFLFGPRSKAKINYVEIPTTDFATPAKDNVLIYGFLENPHSSEYSIIDFVQLDQTKDQIIASPKTKKSLLMFSPLPTDLFLKLTYITYTASNTVYEFNMSLNSSDSITIKAKKSGLYYFGSYKLQMLKGDHFSIVKSDKHTEMEALKELQKELKGTAWEELITKRMEELQ